MTGGHGMLALVDWVFPRQAAAAQSSTETEVVGGADCARSTFPIDAVFEKFVS